MSVDTITCSTCTYKLNNLAVTLITLVTVLHMWMLRVVLDYTGKLHVFML